MKLKKILLSIHRNTHKIFNDQDKMDLLNNSSATLPFKSGNSASTDNVEQLPNF